MRLLISIILFFIILTSCSSDDITKNFEVGREFLDDNIQIRIIDTFSISASTYKSEELTTSGSNRILLGYLEDDVLGKLTAQPYFQLTRSSFLIGNNNIIDENDTYDSIALVMNFDRYYEGDTLVEQTYKVHRVIEEFEPIDDEQSFFNNSSLLYETDEILGEVSVKPRPNRSTDSLYIPLNDAIGLEIFEKIRDEDIASSNDFTNFLNGITIIPNQTENSSVIGFNSEIAETITDNTYIRLYLTPENTENDIDYIDFFITDISKKFNSITSTDLNPNLAFIEEDSENTVSSENTNDLSYIQAGTGINTRIDLPSIRKIKEISDFGSSLSAELTFKISNNSFDRLQDLENSLSVFIVNNDNIIQRQLVSLDGTPILALLNNDDDLLFNPDTFYSIDLSQYVDEILNSERTLEQSLMIQFTDQNTTVRNTVINVDNNDDLKLSVKYLTYQ